jgi:spermidine synthase
MDVVTTSIPKPATTTFLLGVSTVIAQSVLLREAMAAMGGSEMAWGLVMALWLAGMGLGARVGVLHGTVRVATHLPLISLALAAGGTVLLRAAPAVVDVSPGETVTTLHAVWLWAVAVIPAAAAGGVAFPILAGAIGPTGAGRAYALEATGALLGGTAFSFALAPLGTAATLLISIAAVAGLSLWRMHPLLAVGLAIACVAATIPADEGLARAGWRWAGRTDELAAWAETRLQRFESSAGPPTALYTDGRLVASYPDPYSTFPPAHLVMLLHPEPRRVLAVGCAADGSLEALIRHPVDELLVVEDDPDLPPLLGRWFGADFHAALRDPAVRTSRLDPVRAVAGERDLDLIILADGDPVSLRANRTRTAEFYRRCRSAMNDEGILIARVGVADTYLGGVAGQLLASTVSTLREVFPVVAAVPGERVTVVAAGPGARLTLEVDELARRLRDRPEAATELPLEMIALLVDPARRTSLEDFVGAADTAANTVLHPRSVAMAVGLHEARSMPVLARTLADLQDRGPRLLLWLVGSLVVVLLTAAAFNNRRVRALAAAGLVGATSMGWWLLLLATWQATRGSVYAEIGVLTGLFMAGVAVGGWIGVRAVRPARWLPWILGGGVLLSLFLAAGAGLWAPVPIVQVLLVTGGCLTGLAFPGLGELAGQGSSRRGAGLAFAADEIGAALAALTIGTVAIPWVGMTATALGLAALGLAAVPAALRR